MPSTLKKKVDTVSSSVNKKALEKAGFYNKNQTSSTRKSIINKVTTKPQRVEMVEKMLLTKKTGGVAKTTAFKDGGKSAVNSAGNYTQPSMRKALFEKIKAGTKGGDASEWSARKAQLLASEYKKKGGGYRD